MFLPKLFDLLGAKLLVFINKCLLVCVQQGITVLEHFSELQLAHALNQRINTISCLLEYVSFKPGQVIFNALRSVEADFLDRLQELFPPDRGRSTAAVGVRFAWYDKTHVVIENAEEPFPPCFFQLEECKRPIAPKLQLTPDPVITETAALLGFVVEPYSQLRLRTAKVAGMRPGYFAVLVRFAVNFRVRFAEFADVSSEVGKLADLDDIKQTFSVFGLVYIIIRNIKSGDMELLLVRADFFEQLREVLTTGGFKLPATPTKSRLTNPSRPRSSRSRKLLRILPNTVTEKTV